MTEARTFKQFSGNLTDPDWWRGGVVYQIYPRSYQDSNGDGIGDLNGISQRLPYIAALGVDAIWLSPFFKSPMKDFGYDVSDYCAVDPMFGTLEDFTGMLEHAHRLGLRVIIDQVLSHTADSHSWFTESRADQTNPKADWYVWADAKGDGTPPNNWLSIFGGSGWQWDTAREQYYLHNFLTSQPDLNVHNPQLQQALLETMRFWLELGVDGFRFDTVNFYMHDPLLRDNPPKGRPQGIDAAVNSVNPYAWQWHRYDKTQPENIPFLKRIRAMLDEYPGITTVGEVSADDSLDVMAEYTNGGDKLHTAYSFDLLSEACSAPHLHRILANFEQRVSDGWACWAISNHDVVRVATRWGGNQATPQALKLYAALQLSLRGSPCIYQGDELGLPEAELLFEELQDPYGITMWPAFKGRDGCRTPMPWSAAAPHAGFSSADKTWLSLAAPHLSLAADVQQQQSDSVLAHYQNFLKWRKTLPVLINGEIALLSVDDQVLAFVRNQDGKQLLCAFNLSASAAGYTLPADIGALSTCEGHGFSAAGIKDQQLDLAAWGVCFAWVN
ncbi:MAG: alpha glucosidase [Oxalobacteraceae bacterium]|nr:alpha glucosidase [Oxalobacteraceae bacterium]